MKFVRVFILGRDFRPHEVGRIMSDGRNVWPSPVTTRLEMIATQPLFSESPGGAIEETGPDHSEAFLAGLARQYKGSRLWCGPVEDDATLESSDCECGAALIEGGPGSGNFGHEGRPGEIGGSGPGRGESLPKPSTGLKHLSTSEMHGHDGSPKDPLPCGDDLDLAVRALADGKAIKLDQPAQVSTLLDKMDRAVQRSIALGEKAPTFDLCGVSVPGTNLFCHESIGVPRAQMPQLKGKPVAGTYAATLTPNKKGKVDISREFIEHLRDSGIKVKKDDIRASHIRASQSQIDGARVAQLVKEAKLGERDLRADRIFVTRDNYVLDGHHHWAADVGLGYSKDKDLKIPVYKVDMDIGQAIRMANDFSREKGIAPKSVP